jgi:hypothetical protein
VNDESLTPIFSESGFQELPLTSIPFIFKVVVVKRPHDNVSPKAEAEAEAAKQTARRYAQCIFMMMDVRIGGLTTLG